MIHIRPEVAMYAAFARLNYKPWYALAEFVDNSIQSATSNINALRRLHGADYKLRVDVLIGDDRIEITDNAYGIEEADYARAFAPASPPRDNTGLSEFGLGMKAAASWFAKVWFVRTKPVGTGLERTIIFDVPQIVANKIENLEIQERPAKTDDHYTCVTLTKLNVKIAARTLGKVRAHLASIYRHFIDDGLLVLRVDNETLTYSKPKLLHAASFEDPDGQTVEWHKTFSVSIDPTHEVSGWAGLLETGSVSNAGFSVFRRRRLIQGSAGEAYRPERLFGKANKYVYQRLVGELDVRGFSVSHTKDGIHWDEWEDDILDAVRSALNEGPLKMIDQANHYRARATTPQQTRKAALADGSQLVTQHFGELLGPTVSEPLPADPTPAVLDPPSVSETPPENSVIEVQHEGTTWRILLEMIEDETMGDWYEVAHSQNDDGSVDLTVRVNLSNAFVRRSMSPDGREATIFTRMAIGLGIAEVRARLAGVRQAGAVRLYLNKVLGTVLSGPMEE